MWYYPVLFPHLHAVGQLVIHPSSRIISLPMDKKLSWPLSAHPPSEKAMTLDRGRIRIPRFIWSPSTLAFCGIAQSLPPGVIDGDSSFIEDETGRSFLYLSGTFREELMQNILISVFHNFGQDMPHEQITSVIERLTQDEQSDLGYIEEGRQVILWGDIVGGACDSIYWTTNQDPDTPY